MYSFYCKILARASATHSRESKELDALAQLENQQMTRWSEVKTSNSWKSSALFRADEIMPNPLFMDGAQDTVLGSEQHLIEEDTAPDTLRLREELSTLPPEPVEVEAVIPKDQKVTGGFVLIGQHVITDPALERVTQKWKSQYPELYHVIDANLNQHLKVTSNNDSRSKTFVRKRVKQEQGVGRHITERMAIDLQTEHVEKIQALVRALIETCDTEPKHIIIELQREGKDTPETFCFMQDKIQNIKIYSVGLNDKRTDLKELSFESEVAPSSESDMYRLFLTTTILCSLNAPAVNKKRSVAGTVELVVRDMDIVTPTVDRTSINTLSVTASPPKRKQLPARLLRKKTTKTTPVKRRPLLRRHRPTRSTTPRKPTTKAVTTNIERPKISLDAMKMSTSSTVATLVKLKKVFMSERSRLSVSVTPELKNDHWLPIGDFSNAATALVHELEPSRIVRQYLATLAESHAAFKQKLKSEIGIFKGNTDTLPVDLYSQLFVIPVERLLDVAQDFFITNGDRGYNSGFSVSDTFSEFESKLPEGVPTESRFCMTIQLFGEKRSLYYSPEDIFYSMKYTYFRHQRDLEFDASIQFEIDWDTAKSHFMQTVQTACPAHQKALLMHEDTPDFSVFFVKALNSSIEKTPIERVVHEDILKKTFIATHVIDKDCMANFALKAMRCGYRANFNVNWQSPTIDALQQGGVTTTSPKNLLEDPVHIQWHLRLLLVEQGVSQENIATLLAVLPTITCKDLSDETIQKLKKSISAILVEKGLKSMKMRTLSAIKKLSERSATFSHPVIIISDTELVIQRPRFSPTVTKRHVSLISVCDEIYQNLNDSEIQGHFLNMIRDWFISGNLSNAEMDLSNFLADFQLTLYRANISDDRILTALQQIQSTCSTMMKEDQWRQTQHSAYLLVLDTVSKSPTDYPTFPMGQESELEA